MPPNYKVVKAGFLDKPVGRAVLLSVAVFIVAIVLSRMAWSYPVGDTGVFQQVNLPPPLAPTLVPSLANGGISALLPAMREPSVPEIVAPDPVSRFNIPSGTIPKLSDTLNGSGGETGIGHGLGDGLGTQLSSLLFQLPILSDGSCSMTDSHTLHDTFLTIIPTPARFRYVAWWNYPPMTED